MNRLYIISRGVGGTNCLSLEAYQALEESEAVVAYSKYVRELKALVEGKELYTSGMTHEVERCNQAIELAQSGKTTSVISNGDANVFGVASLIVEIMDAKNLWNEIELISLPGVTSFLAAASKVGAPVSQDFSIISLSERLMDIDLIDKRVQAVLDCDFVLGVYNPKSKRHVQPYKNFLNRLKDVDERIVIIAQNVGKEDKEEITVTTSLQLIQEGIEYDKIGINTLIIVCNSSSKLTKNGKVLTPRRYFKK